MGGVEVCGKGGGVWEGWRCVGGVEVCGRGGGAGVGWRCVGGVEECGKGGGVWEEVQVCGKGWRSVDGGVVGGVEEYGRRVEECGGRE